MENEATVEWWSAEISLVLGECDCGVYRVLFVSFITYFCHEQHGFALYHSNY